MEGKLSKSQISCFLPQRNFFFLAKNVTGRDTLHGGWSTETRGAREKSEKFFECSNSKENDISREIGQE